MAHLPAFIVEVILKYINLTQILTLTQLLTIKGELKPKTCRKKTLKILRRKKKTPKQGGERSTVSGIACLQPRALPNELTSRIAEICRKIEIL